jgi:hypothetical protein
MASARHSRTIGSSSTTITACVIVFLVPSPHCVRPHRRSSAGSAGATL